MSRFPLLSLAARKGLSGFGPSLTSGTPDHGRSLASLGMALCWLTPNHFMPWLSFDADFGTAVVMMLLAAGWWVAGQRSWQVPGLALGMLAAALVPPAQWAAGLIHYGGDAWLFAIGLAGLGMAITLGASLARDRPGYVADVVFGAAVWASIVSVGIQLWQWLQVAGVSDFDGLGLWLLNLPTGARPFANLGQPNQMSTLLLWGLAGLGWWFSRRRIGGTVATFAAAYLLFGLAMTQSRSGWLGLSAMTVMVWVYRRPLDTFRHRGVLVGLLAGFVVVTACWSPINDALHFSAAESMENRLSPGARLLNWKVCLAAIAQNPWFGFGWGQVAVAQQAAALSHPASGEYFAYAHNLVLDLLLWNGVPIGAVMALSLAAWLVRRFRRVDSAEGALLSMALAAFLIHALLEYPHAYFYFLLPVGLMLGALDAVSTDRAWAGVPRSWVAAALVVMSLLLAWIAHDYRQASKNMEQLRFESARIGSSRQSRPPDIVLLTQLREYLTASRVNVHLPVDAPTLDGLRKASERYASDATLFRYAMAAVVSGRADLAVPALRRLCHLNVKDRCAAVLAAWDHQASTRHPEMKAISEKIAH